MLFCRRKKVFSTKMCMLFCRRKKKKKTNLVSPGNHKEFDISYTHFPIFLFKIILHLCPSVVHRQTFKTI